MSERAAYLITLSEHLCPLASEDGLFTLSVPEQVFVAAWELQAEVNDGGFSQYYASAAGDHAEQAVRALEAIGAAETADIVRRANALFPEGPPADADLRVERLETLEAECGESLDALTDAFCSQPEDLADRLWEFVQEHSEQIRAA